MRRAYLHAVLACVPCAAVGVAVACGGNGAVTYEQPFDASAFVDHFVEGVSVGEACSEATPCRLGLTCNGTCAPSHASPPGTPCTISAECAPADYCGSARTCSPAGSGAQGSTCASDGDCLSGFRCDLIGLDAECAPDGTTDVGGACATSADCFGGLACAGGECTSLPASTTGGPPLSVPTWSGATCADDSGPVAAYFRVPRGSGDGDFFRLPFPNDVRLLNGAPNLAGFPTPGTAILGYDLVSRYLSDVQSSEDGWSTYPTVTLRFSGSIDLGSLKRQGALQWVEVNSDGSTTPVSFGWTATTGRNQYVCNNSVSARPQEGLPIDPGRTFLFIVTNVATAPSDVPIAVSPDLTALLGSSAPSDPSLAAVYATYAPLRAWAAANNTTPIVDATVFTTAHTNARAPKIIQAVTAAPVPTATSWVKCGGATPSPCPQATGDRACGAQDPDFDELQALVTLPIVQAGTEPYATPDQGGDVPLDSTGTPSVQRTEQVCMALTIPHATPGDAGAPSPDGGVASKIPVGGWPLVVYAHGTDGSFRSHITLGVASSLANAKSSAGVATPMAVLGIDQVEHGTRRGASTDTPDHLFFNFSNPGAARGNPLQAAADQASLVRFAQTLSLPASITGSASSTPETFGPIAFWGHSQGATAGSIAMPYVNGVSGIVLSGQGASLVDALLTKKNPVDIADVVPTVLEEPSVDAFHPALAIFQASIDPADPVNHAIAISAVPVGDAGPKSVFQPYGLGDTYAPPVTQATYAIAARFGVAAAPPEVATPDKIGGAVPMPVPASGNVGSGATATTALVREYQPSGYDGHFVSTQDTTAELDVATFLADAVSGAIPKVGQ